MFESIVEQATNELIEHLSRKADNTVKTKAIPHRKVGAILPEEI